MDSERYKSFLLSNIKPWAKLAGGGREINCRCFYCFDSKQSNHGHFYISIPQSKEEFSQFYCQKCKAKGIVTQKTLIEWGLYDNVIASDLIKHNRGIKINPSMSSSLQVSKYFINPVHYQYNESNLTKLKYINTRLGTNLTIEDCVSLKIILNLYEVLKANNIPYSRHENIIYQLSDGFVGFLSYDNSFINFRNLNMIPNLYSAIDKRYINYNIFNKFDNTQRFYTIPAQIDFMKPISIHIAEGPFDILSIYLNLRSSIEKENAIFCSVAGSGYLGLLRLWIIQLGTPFLDIHIYPDNDVNDIVFMQFKEQIKPFGYSITIHRNIYSGEKDFGVPKNRILESIYKI